jgi:hypothetical protein
MTVDQTAVCALNTSASRRFYIHIGSLGFLVAVQPTMFERWRMPWRCRPRVEP